MLAHGLELLHDARAQQRAIAAITTYTLESTRAICAAAEQVGQPVILQAGSSSFGAVGLDLLAGCALLAAKQSSVPIGVHLDHSRDLAEVRRCVELGYTSVMIDGSHLPFEDNVALTREVVELGHAAGVWVEGELGKLPGDEDVSTDALGGEYTDPRRAAEYVQRTGVDALAVAIGNVHGMTARPVRLDLERLRLIAASTPVPLVLHGASGLSEADIRGAIDGGVAKINFNAEVRRAYLAAFADLDKAADDVVRLQRRAIENMTEVAQQKISLLAR